jgi:acetylornithine deacetylase/succinyl-diaminopimelate desuccinylase-like protein
MTLRRDAIAGSAEMVTAIEEIATAAAEDGDVVATVGEFAPAESAINKVCGEVTFSIDIRSNNNRYRDQIEERILEQVRTIANERELDVTTTLVDRSPPVELDDQMRELLADVVDSLDLSSRKIPSGGGHDAMNFQHAGIPTGMVFVPSVDGISHSPKEETPTEAIRKVAAIFTQAILSGPPKRD